MDGCGSRRAACSFRRIPAIQPRWSLPSRRAHFFLTHRLQDPFGNVATAAYDAQYTLALVSTQDAVGNQTTAQPDFRVLQPAMVTDPNGNRTARSSTPWVCSSAPPCWARRPARCGRRFFRQFRRRPRAITDRRLLRGHRPDGARPPRILARRRCALSTILTRCPLRGLDRPRDPCQRSGVGATDERATPFCLCRRLWPRGTDQGAGSRARST